MSHLSTHWAIAESPVQNPGEHVVLIVMAEYLSADSCWCFAARKDIAKRAHMSERSVQRHWRELESRGVIELDEHCDHVAFLHIPERYRPTAWRLNMHLTRNDDEPVDEADDDGRGDNLSPLTEGRQTGSARGDNLGRSGVTLLSPKEELKGKRKEERRTTRAHSARPPATADEHAPPARVIGGNGSAPAAANGTGNGAATGVPRRIRQPDRKPPGPDTGGGLVEHFTALADRHGVNGPMEISAGALGRNLTSWLRQGMDAEEVRALMDAFYAGRDGWRGDTPLWRRFIGDAYRLRQNRRRTEVDYFAGLEVIGVEDTPFAQALRDDAAKANGTGS